MNDSMINSFVKLHVNETLSHTVIRSLNAFNTVFAVRKAYEKSAFIDLFHHDSNTNCIIQQTYLIEWIYNSTCHRYYPDIGWWEYDCGDGYWENSTTWKYHRIEQFYANFDSLIADKAWYCGSSSLGREYDPDDHVLAFAEYLQSKYPQNQSNSL